MTNSNANAGAPQNAARPANVLGVIAMAIAAAGLILAIVHMTAGPFAPQKPAEQTIAETAVAIRDAAVRAMTGAEAPPPAPPAPRYDVDDYVQAGVIGFGGVAMILACVALIRREERATALYGFSLGAGVLLLTWLQWIAVMICGVIILAAIIGNLGDILGGISV